MPVALNIKDDIKRATRRLTDIEKRQIPFATSGAINDTLFDVRKQIVGVTAPRAFKIRNRRFFGVAFRVENAKRVKLKGAVFDRLGRAEWGMTGRGGTKKRRGSTIDGPTKSIKGKGVSSGKIPKRLTPSQLLKNPKGRRKAFATTFASGQKAIVRRTTKKRLPLEVLYLGEKSALIGKEFDFSKDATKVAKRVMPRHFAKRLRQALRTARP